MTGPGRISPDNRPARPSVPHQGGMSARRPVGPGRDDLHLPVQKPTFRVRADRRTCPSPAVLLRLGQGNVYTRSAHPRRAWEDAHRQALCLAWEVACLALLDEVMEHNARFVSDRERPITKRPAKKIALFTCMDTRLVEFLEPAMGIRRGDAQVIKNAGNTLIDPTGGVIRSLVVAIFGMGCAEVYVVGHRDCGMAQIDEAGLRERMEARGVPMEAIDALQPSLRDWLGAFHDPAGNVLRVVEEIRHNPLIPGDVPVHGLIFDPVSGRLELLADGNRPAQ